MVLRLWHRGYLFYGLDADLEGTPVFTLYGDGRVIYANRSTDLSDDNVELRISQLTAQQVEDLLTLALEEYGLAGADEESGTPLGTDLPTAYFRFDAAGMQRTVIAHDLRGPDDERPERRPLSELRDYLNSFHVRVESGDFEDDGAFAPTIYRAMLYDATWFSDPGEESPADWPWSAISPGDFEETEFGPWLLVPIRDGEEAQAALQLPEGINGYPAVRSPHDDTVYLLRMRPLLPDEAFLIECVEDCG